MTLNSLHISGVTQISLKLSHSEDKNRLALEFLVFLHCLVAALCGNFPALEWV